VSSVGNTFHDLATATPVPRHFQDTPVYCGAACAQMVLYSCGVTCPDQTALYLAVKSSSDWATAPGDLAATLNQSLSGLGAPYRDITFGARGEMMQRIAWSLCHYRLPVVALVETDHWVVIDGIVAAQSAGVADQQQPKIASVLVKDPLPDLQGQREGKYPGVGDAPPPPHPAMDMCSTPRREEEAYSWSAWEDVFLACTTDGFWSGQYVAVCVPCDHVCLPWRSPACGSSATGAPEPEQTAVPVSQRIGSPPAPGGRPGRGAVLDQETLRGRAIDGLAEAGLLNRRGWADATNATVACPPLRVRRLDSDDEYVILVLDKAGGETMLVRLTRSGEFRHAMLRPSPRHIESLVAVASEKENRLVWTRCGESRSPLFPLVEIGAKGTTVFRSLGGREFSKLSRHWR
jgi:hypothetical protein